MTKEADLFSAPEGMPPQEWKPLSFLEKLDILRREERKRLKEINEERE